MMTMFKKILVEMAKDFMIARNSGDNEKMKSRKEAIRSLLFYSYTDVEAERFSASTFMPANAGYVDIDDDEGVDWIL